MHVICKPYLDQVGDSADKHSEAAMFWDQNNLPCLNRTKMILYSFLILPFHKMFGSPVHAKYISHPSACSFQHSNGLYKPVWMDHQIIESYQLIQLFFARVSKQLTQTSRSWGAICTSKCPAGALFVGWMFPYVFFGASWWDSTWWGWRSCMEVYRKGLNV